MHRFRARLATRAGLAACALLLASCGGSEQRAAEEASEAQFEAPREPLLRSTLTSPAAGEPVALFDPVDVLIELWLPEGWSAEDPELAAPADFAADGEPRRLTGAPEGWRRFAVTWRPTTAGDLEIPARTLLASRGEEERSLSSRAIPLTVASVLEDLPEGVDAEAIEAPGAAFPERRPIQSWLLPVGAVVLLAALGLWWWLRRRRGRTQLAPDQVELPAHVEALRALARERNAPRRTAAEIDSFYVGVTSALRRYLERRFGLHAPERTTEEFLPELERSGVLDRDTERRLGRFLERCDLVKFAGELPQEAAHDEALRFAEELVHATRIDRIEAAGGGPVPSPAEGAA